MGANRFRFRAWDADEEKMVFSDNVDFDDDHMDGDYFWVFDEQGSPEAYGIGEPCTDNPEDCGHSERLSDAMQSTGLLDSNGVEIFEGDVVRWSPLDSDNYADIRWIQDGCCFSWGEDTILYQDQMTKAEVIGNIHQHPHLIDAECGKGAA